MLNHLVVCVTALLFNITVVYQPCCLTALLFTNHVVYNQNVVEQPLVFNSPFV